MPKRLPAELRLMFRAAADQGWTFDTSTSGHVMFRSPDGRSQVLVDRNPAARGMANTRARLRRAGLRL